MFNNSIKDRLARFVTRISIALLIILISSFPSRALTVQAASTSNDVCQCTAYVYSQRPDILPKMGDAKNWIYSANRRGYSYDQTPYVGDVVVFLNGVYKTSLELGHVAMVTWVNSSHTQFNAVGWDGLIRNCTPSPMNLLSVNSNTWFIHSTNSNPIQNPPQPPAPQPSSGNLSFNPVSPVQVGQIVTISVTINPGNDFRAARLLIDYHVLSESSATTFSYSWNTSGLLPSVHNIRLEIASRNDTNWAYPNSYETTYLLREAPQSSNRSPNIPTILSPLDKQSLPAGNQLCWHNNGDPDGDQTTSRAEIWGAFSWIGPWLDGENPCWSLPSPITGQYTWAVRSRDSKGAESGASSAWAFIITGSPVVLPSTINLIANPKSIASGGAITVSWDSLNASGNDWISMHPAGAGDGTLVVWKSISGSSGSTTFTAPSSPGSFEFRLFRNGQKVATSNTFQVVTSGTAPSIPGTATLSVSPASTGSGDTVTVSWGNLETTGNDWVSMHFAGSNDGSYLNFKSISGSSGSTTFTAPSSAGTYDFRLFRNGQKVATSNAFQVVTSGTGSSIPGATTLSVSPASIGQGGSVTVSWENLVATGNDWVSIHLAGSADGTYLTWKFISGNSGSISFPAPSNSGGYDIRLFRNGTKVATTKSFQVIGGAIVPATSVPGATTLNVSSGSIDPGGTVTVSWGNLVTTGNDWISMHPAGSGDGSYITWKFITGSSGSTTFTAPMSGGTYDFRLFRNGLKVAVSNSVQVVAEGSATATSVPGATTLNVSPASIGPDGTVTVSWNNLATTGNDWISLHPAGAGDGTYLDWKNTSGSSGSMTFTTPSTSGNYEFRLFRNGTKVASSNTFQVVGVATTATSLPGSTTLNANPGSIGPGGTLTVSWNNLATTGNDWISLHPAGAGDGTYLDWKNTSGSSGSMTFTTPSTSGNYEFRLFRNGTKVATSNVFQVTGAAIATSIPATPVPATPVPESTTLNANPGSIGPGGTLTVSWNNLATTGNDWISLHPAGAGDGTYLDWKNTSGSSGSMTFTAPSSSGSYEFRLFRNGTKVATSNVFQVTGAAIATSIPATPVPATPVPPTPVPATPVPATPVPAPPIPASTTLNVSPATIGPGGSVIVSWANLDQTGNDWISMHPAGAEDATYLTWQSISGSSGSITFTAPSNPGSYEFRLFRNGTKVAGSNTFQVE